MFLADNPTLITVFVISVAVVGRDFLQIQLCNLNLHGPIAVGSVVVIRLKGKLIIGNSTEMKTAPSLATSSETIDLDTSMRNRLSQHSYLLDMNITLLSVHDSPNYHKNDHGTNWMTKCDEFSEV